ncbi:tRNA threonylcarbamoyladenosine dehydratase [Stieleria maiorica]|uniref:tRNA threonylcarbamoyladenosine dehydratase n=1 Tax=Stieleria maiorica TaxID=2795974 RepID=A0A5B9MI35_9BACT|nr:ThiF family adenylyltransferase [Stieleria maiorica]QEF99660.1 tRNA threonylcarbamoyladenosine dehydratase [Stieleria maiorica]
MTESNQQSSSNEASNDLVWDYDDAFCRNRGLISPEEQQRIRQCRVAIPGMGGVGGLNLMTLARMGVGKFRVADADSFNVGNFNRQFGALRENIGRPKVEVLAASAQAVNPEAEIDALNGFVSEENIGTFLEGVDLVVDSLDFFAFDARRMLFREAHARGIWAITAGPVGFSTIWLAFDPNGMSFDSYFDLKDGMTPADQFAAMAVGLAPRPTHLPYFDYSYIDYNSGSAPSVSAACRLASGVVGVEAVKILLGRGKVRAAPCYNQFDAYRYIHRKGWIPMGNRNPIQRIKRRILRQRMINAGYGSTT